MTKEIKKREGIDKIGLAICCFAVCWNIIAQDLISSDRSVSVLDMAICLFMSLSIIFIASANYYSGRASGLDHSEKIIKDLANGIIAQSKEIDAKQELIAELIDLEEKDMQLINELRAEIEQLKNGKE